MPVQGIERVKRQLKQTITRIAGPVTEKGVYAILSQAAGIAQTMTPIDTSNLINSQYAPEITQTPKGTIGKVGYTAEYAFAVHNAPGTLEGQDRANGNGAYWDPGGEPEFLSKAFEEIEPRIPAILRGIHRV